jgi:hypothetical protein
LFWGEKRDTAMPKTYLEHIAAKIADGDAHAPDGVLPLREAIFITPEGRLVRMGGEPVR